MSDNDPFDLEPDTALLAPKRHIDRSILVLNANEETLLEKNWNEFHRGIGLFSGLGIKWREQLVDELENLFIEDKAVTEIYYQGLRDEFVYLCHKLNYYKVQYNITNDILCEYVNPGIEDTFVEISEDHMNKIMALAEASISQAEAFLDESTIAATDEDTRDED